MAKILITGATGNIGEVLTRHLKPNHELVLVDINFSESDSDLLDGTTTKQADLTKLENWEGLLDSVEYVIQLAGNPNADADFYDGLLDMNYKLPYNLYATASKTESVKRIIFASSIHAVDAYPLNVQVSTKDPFRPADHYGVSKVYLEALATYYAYVEGLESIGIRIGDFKSPDENKPEEPTPDSMAMYLSPDDMCRLVDSALAAELKEPYLIVNGVSNNTFPRLDIEQARVEIGYEPQDNGFHKYNFFK